MLSPNYEKACEEDKIFYIENWYSMIKEHTAKTYFTDITIEEAKAIVKFYRYYSFNREAPTNEELKTIHSIKNKIQQILKGNGFKKHSKPFFIRLSNRSPKDGELFNKQNLTEHYNEEYNKIISTYDPLKWEGLNQNEIEANFKILANCKCSDKYTIKCKDIDDAMNLILTSERVYVDLYREIKTLENNSDYKYETKIAIREWVQMNGEKEFRCFVKNNNMTAITQYNHYIMVEDLLDKEYLVKTKKLLYDYWKESISMLLTELKDYVIDLAVLDSNKVTVIELNPCNNLTGSGMFMWEGDKEVLHGNKDGLFENIEFRVRETPYPNICDLREVMLDDLKEVSKKKNYKEILEKLEPSSKCCIY